MNQNNTTEYESSYFAERPILLVAGMCLLALLPIGLLMILIYGSINGSEFSPDDFTRRTFSYHRIPWLDLTVSGIEYTDVTSELEQTLLTNGLIKQRKPAAGQKKTWHLFYDSGVPDSYACDARFLTSYLNFSDWDSTVGTSTPYWLTWNEKFPQCAKIFWPTIADLARHEMYLVIPDTMRFGLNLAEDDPQQFQTDLNEVARSGWIRLSESDLETDKNETAVLRLLRAQLIDQTDDVAKLIDGCRDRVENFSTIESNARSASEALKARIAEALSSDGDSGVSDDAPLAEAPDPSSSTDPAETKAQ